MQVPLQHGDARAEPVGDISFYNSFWLLVRDALLEDWAGWRVMCHFPTVELFLQQLQNHLLSTSFAAQLPGACMIWQQVLAAFQGRVPLASLGSRSSGHVSRGCSA